MKANKKPFFTIGIPTYNRAHYLKFAIESVLKQDFKNYEILIIDNHSTDNTTDVVHLYRSKHKNIIYIKNVINNGSIKSFIKIFHRARGKYLFFLCDDDIILKKGTLSGLYEIIQSKKPGFIKLEALFYYKNKNNIIKCFKFDHKNTIIKPNDPYFIEKTFDKFLQFWSGNIYKLDSKLFYLIDAKEWLYTSLDYIYAQIKRYGVVFTGNYCILGHYHGISDMTNIIEPIFSFDTYLEVIKKYTSIEDYKKIDDDFRKTALYTIINCKLYASTRQVMLYIYKVFKNDKKPLGKIHYYIFAILVFITPKIVFVYIKKFIYHPMLKKEVNNYIKERNLASLLPL